MTVTGVSAVVTPFTPVAIRSVCTFPAPTVSPRTVTVYVTVAPGVGLVEVTTRSSVGQEPGHVALARGVLGPDQEVLPARVARQVGRVIGVGDVLGAVDADPHLEGARCWWSRRR